MCKLVIGVVFRKLGIKLFGKFVFEFLVNMFLWMEMFVLVVLKKYVNYGDIIVLLLRGNFIERKKMMLSFSGS